MTSKKNTFDRMTNPLNSGSVAEQFISTAQPQATQSKAGRPKKKGETKQNVTLSLLPSVYQDIQKLAKINGTSASALIGDLCEQYIEENPDQMKLYDKIFKE